MSSSHEGRRDGIGAHVSRFEPFGSPISGHGRFLTLESLRGDDFVAIPVADLRRIMEGPILRGERSVSQGSASSHFPAPIAPPSEVLSQESAVSSEENGHVRRRRGWFRRFPFCNRQARSRSPSPPRPQAEPQEIYAFDPSPDVPSGPRLRRQLTPSPVRAIPSEASSVRSFRSNEAETRSVRSNETEGSSPPRAHVFHRNPFWPEVSQGSDPFQVDESDEASWRLGMRPRASDFENAAREIEAAMHSLLLDELSGAFLGRARRGQRVPWLSDDEEGWTYEELLELDKNNVKIGLKPKEMKVLARRRLTSADATAECRICIQETSCGELVTSLPCEHSYHDACITPWLMNHRTCPICRYEFPRQQNPETKQT